MADLLRFTTEAGVHHVIKRDENGLLTDHASQRVDQILDRNKAMASHNDGYSPDRSMRRVASIPFSVILKWKLEEGWDAFDPANADKLASKLNSSEFAYLRTAPGQLGVSNGVMR